VTRFQWLLGLHVLGAFLFVSGAVLAGLLQLTAMRRERPSEIALLLRLTRVGVVTVAVGALVTLALGIWLTDELAGVSASDGWIVASLVLWAVSLALGGVGGRAARHARYEAERLAAQGDRPSPELNRLLADPAAFALNYGSLAAALAVLGLMIWKPGA